MNEQRPQMNMRGSLHISKYYQKPTQPRFYGKATVNGVTYKIKAWEKVGPTGEPWISILFEDPEGASLGTVEQAAKPLTLFSEHATPAGPGAPKRAMPAADPLYFDQDDDIPF